MKGRDSRLAGRYQRSLIKPMSPIAKSDGHDAPGLVGELVPGMAAMVDDVVVAGEDAVGEPVIADELPDILLRVQLRRARRQRQQRDVGRNVEPARASAGSPTHRILPAAIAQGREASSAPRHRDKASARLRRPGRARRAGPRLRWYEQRIHGSGRARRGFCGKAYRSAVRVRDPGSGHHRIDLYFTPPGDKRAAVRSQEYTRIK